MTPGKAGGYEVEDGFQSPEGGDTSHNLYRRLRGSPILNRLPTTGYTRGHNCIAPSEQDFPINRPLFLNS